MKFENAVSGSGEDGEAEGNDIVVKKSNEGPSSATAIDQPGKQQSIRIFDYSIHFLFF